MYKSQKINKQTNKRRKNHTRKRDLPKRAKTEGMGWCDRNRSAVCSTPLHYMGHSTVGLDLGLGLTVVVRSWLRAPWLIFSLVFVLSLCSLPGQSLRALFFFMRRTVLVSRDDVLWLRSIERNWPFAFSHLPLAMSTAICQPTSYSERQSATYP